MLRAGSSRPRLRLVERLWSAALGGAALVVLSALGAACSGVIGEGGNETEGASSGGDTASSTSSTSGAQGSSGAPAGSTGATTSQSSSQGAGGAGEGGAGPGSGGASSSASTGSGAGGSEPQEPAICKRWKDDHVGLTEGTWSGNVAACNPGDVSADGRASALKLVNLYRFMASLPAVTNDPTRDQKAQACALMMDANNMLNHSPPMNWACYSADGAEAAGNSNIASGPGLQAVDLYMSDFGNETTMGHRRWILSGSLGPIGLGSTSAASCMWVIGGNGNQNPPFTAWPPPGEFPIQAINLPFSTIDKSGWTIQSSVIDLSGAQVSVKDGGQNRPMTVTQLLANYGSTWAIRMVPSGWTSQVGHTYSVVVSGVSQQISYDVEIVDCP